MSVGKVSPEPIAHNESGYTKFARSANLSAARCGARAAKSSRIRAHPREAKRRMK